MTTVSEYVIELFEIYKNNNNNIPEKYLNAEAHSSTVNEEIYSNPDEAAKAGNNRPGN